MTISPPLIAMMSGAKVRARRERVPAPKELKLQITVADLLREHCREGWQWAHYPSGEIRDIRAAAKLKAMGLRRGRPDFELISPWVVPHFLELKRTSKSKLTDDQKDFRNWCIKVGAPYVVAWNIDQVLTAFDDWGCLNIILPKRAGDEC